MSHRQFAMSYLTTAPLDVAEALVVAQEAGYAAIGIRLAPLAPGGHYSPLGENSALLREIQRRSQDTGVAILDVEGVRLDEHFRPGSFERQLAVAAQLGASAISILGDDPIEQRMLESFTGLCDAAAQYGLVCALEFLPYSHVPDCNNAVRILREAGRSNARIVLDFLHAHRSNTTSADVAAVPREWLGYAQLCDAPADIPTTRAGLVHTARYERLLPGEGGIDVRGMARILPDDLPLCVEIPNTRRLARYGPREWAHRALAATVEALE